MSVSKRIAWQEGRIYPVFAATATKADWRRGEGAGLTDHPSYCYAKNNGDIQAAQKVVRDCLDAAYKARIGMALNILKERGVSNPVLVVPTKKDSKNKLAITMARELSREFGLELATNIQQQAGTKSCDKNKLDRIFQTPAFSGKIKKDSFYIAVDDVAETGSTLAGLRSHIERNGATFAMTFALAAPGGNSFNLSPKPEQVNALAKHLGEDLRKWFENQAGFGLEALTFPETRYLKTDSGREDLYYMGAYMGLKTQPLPGL